MTDSLCPLLDAYLDLVDDTESPTLFHRWCMLANLSAVLNRRTRIDMATGPVYPNIYAILLGPPATRKSTAIGISSRILAEAGFNKTANGSTTPQKFLADLYEGFDTLNSKAGELDLDLDLDLNTGTITNPTTKKVSDVLINEGELQDFFGINNFGFISTITNLFDNKPYYDDRTKNGRSTRILNPTISLIGGATGTSFKKMFPLEILGQGLLSRFILVHGAGPRKRSFMPKPFDEKLKDYIVEQLRYLRTAPELPPTISYTPNAYEYSRILYESPQDEITDPRFQYYNGRRNTHYMKMVQLIAMANGHNNIEEGDCILANTILTYTEKFMPKALGEFGLDKQAEHAELIFSIIQQSGTNGVTLKELLNKTLAAIPSANELSGHLIRLLNSHRIDKIQSDDNITRFIQIERLVDTTSKMINYKLLKEYRENPTFDTSFKIDTSKLQTYELAEEFKAIGVETNPSDLGFEVLKGN